MIKRPSKDKAAVYEIQTLAKNFPQGKHLIVDGIFGAHTERVIKKIQEDNGLIPDGIVGVKTWNLLYSKREPSEVRKELKKYLNENDIKLAARELSVDEATIKTVIEVESAGKGFVNNRPIILFEGHVFWDRLIANGIDINKINKTTNKNILYQSWTKAYYSQNQWARLEKAKKIHEVSALESASWGLFQIMGYHWRALGYRSIEEFVKLMGEREYNHVVAFIRYVRYNRLVSKLQTQDWSGFARAYNGPGYRKNDYDGKLRRAYRKYSRRS